MIEAPGLSEALENLEATYRAVGLQGQGAWEESFEGGFACLSPLPHAVSNYAILRQCSADRAKALADWARKRTAFNAYLAPGTDQAEIQNRLQRAGFKETGRLSILVAGPRQTPPAGPSGQTPLFVVTEPREDAIVEARSFDHRLAIGRFMAGQFFGRQTSALRESIAISTARASTRLFALGGGKLKGAAMAMRSGNVLGIYNLCVDAFYRERGYGSDLLAQLVLAAANERITPVLQCEPSLEPWYAKRDFAPQGTILVMGLDR